MKFFDFGAEAHGVIAIGQQATGVIAIGQLATGVIAVGQLARGVIAIGQLSVGLGTLGMLSVGLVHSTGMLAIGAFVRGMGKVPLMPRWSRVPTPELTPVAQLESGDHAAGWVAGTLRTHDAAFVLRERATGRDVPVDATAELSAELLAAAPRRPDVFARLTVRVSTADAEGRRAGYRDAAPVTRALACTAVELAPTPPWKRPAWLAASAAQLVGLAITAVFVFFVGAGPAIEQLMLAFQ